MQNNKDFDCDGTPIHVGDLVQVLSSSVAAPIGLVVKIDFWGVDVLLQGDVERFDPEQLGVVR